jgi:hypothetical protein
MGGRGAVQACGLLWRCAAAAGASDLRPAFVADHDWGEVVLVDEARLSTVARSAEWLALQHLSLGRQLITFAASEPTDP